MPQDGHASGSQRERGEEYRNHGRSARDAVQAWQREEGYRRAQHYRSLIYIYSGNSTL